MLGTYALSAGYYDAYYLKAQKVRTLIKRDFDVLWEQGFDALVAPTSPSVAFRFGAKMADPVAMYLSDACTLPVNMAGLPGISIPCGLSEGLPVGLQLIGAAWSELELFALARGYEAITAIAEWRGKEPAQLAAAADPSAPTPSGAREPSDSPDARRMTAETTRPPLAERALAERVRAVPPSGIRRFFDILATMDDVISLGVGEPDFDTPERIVAAGVRSLHAGPDPLHLELRHDRAAAGPRRPPRAPLRRPLRPRDGAADHRRRVRGGRSRARGRPATRATR